MASGYLARYTTLYSPVLCTRSSITPAPIVGMGFQSAAPDWATAHAAAEQEIAFAAELGQHPAGRLIAVSRRYEDGAVREVFRTLTPRLATGPIRVFALQEQGVDGDVP